MAATKTKRRAVLEHRVTLEQHPAHALTIDERVERAVRPQRVKEIARKLDLDAVGVITVSKRDDGNLVLIDGQHRTLALIERGIGETIVECRVFRGLTIAEEAGLFRRLNNTSKTTAIEDLLKGITEGEDESVAISSIADRFGLKISSVVGPGRIVCAGALRSVYRSGRDGVGPAALGFALHVATSAWGTVPEAVDGHIVAGLGQLYVQFGEEIDRPALIRKLAKHQGGAAGLIGRAKMQKLARPATVARCVAIVVLDLYNLRRRAQLGPL